MRILAGTTQGNTLPVLLLPELEVIPGIELPGVRDAVAAVIHRRGWIALKTGLDLWNVRLPLPGTGRRFGSAFQMRASVDESCIWYVEDSGERLVEDGKRLIEYDGQRQEERREILLESPSQVRDGLSEYLVLSGHEGFYRIDLNGGGRLPSGSGPSTRQGELAAYQRGELQRIVNGATNTSIEVASPGVRWSPATPAFSPSNRWIVAGYVVAGETHQNRGPLPKPNGIAIIDVESGRVSIADDVIEGTPYRFVWSDDEQFVVFGVPYDRRSLRILSLEDMHLGHLRFPRRPPFPILNLGTGEIAMERGTSIA
jgi:hypothetical protein